VAVGKRERGMGGRHIGTRLGQKVETVTRRGRGRARRSGKSRSGDEGKMGRQVRAQGTGAVRRRMDLSSAGASCQTSTTLAMNG